MHSNSRLHHPLPRHSGPLTLGADTRGAPHRLQLIQQAAPAGAARPPPSTPAPSRTPCSPYNIEPPVLQLGLSHAKQHTRALLPPTPPHPTPGARILPRAPLRRSPCEGTPTAAPTWAHLLLARQQPMQWLMRTRIACIIGHPRRRTAACIIGHPRHRTAACASACPQGWDGGGVGPVTLRQRARLRGAGGVQRGRRRVVHGLGGRLRPGARGSVAMPSHASAVGRTQGASLAGSPEAGQAAATGFKPPFEFVLSVIHFDPLPLLAASTRRSPSAALWRAHCRQKQLWWLFKASETVC
jgi:hypothetical protein